jgi:hypothetical protein
LEKKSRKGGLAGIKILGVLNWIEDKETDIIPLMNWFLKAKRKGYYDFLG